MGAPMFLLSLAYADDKRPVYFHAGGRVEADLIAACVEAALGKVAGVGVLKTERQVKDVLRQAMTDGMREALETFKRQSLHVV